MVENIILDISLGVLGTAGSLGLAAGVAKIFALSSGQARIEQKLDDHISQSKNDGVMVRRLEARVGAVESKMPNGELRRVLAKLGKLEKDWAVKTKGNGRKKR